MFFIYFFFFLIFLLLLFLSYYRNNLIYILLGLELVLLNLNIGFSIVALLYDDFFGILISLSIFVLAGSESALGLAFLILYFKQRNTIDIESYVLLYG
jgi:NADH-quinone oxidoreductase subunit K